MAKPLWYASEKPCAKCAAPFVRPDGWSNRKFAHLKLCPSCERNALKARIESGVAIDERGCWLWQRSLKAGTGYGQITVHDRSKLLHPVVFRLYKGDIPSGLEVCHTCDVRRCCNPEHLFLGTRRDNMQDCKSKGRNSKPPRNDGAKHHLAKLSDDQVRELRALAAEGWNQRDLGRRFGVNQSTAWMIMRSRTRKSAGGAELKDERGVG